MTVRTLAALALLAGCTETHKLPAGPGSSQPDLYECEFVDTALGADDEALGTTPSAVAAAFDGQSVHDAIWSRDGSATTATLDLTLDLGQALLRESAGCGMAYIAIPAQAVLATDDGGLTGTWALELQVSEDGSVQGYGSIDASALGGSFEPRALDPNEIRRGFALDLAGSSDGSLEATVLDETEGDDGSVAWAGVEPVLELIEGT